MIVFWNIGETMSYINYFKKFFYLSSTFLMSSILYSQVNMVHSEMNIMLKAVWLLLNINSNIH